jgi:hypothetical protein
MRATSVSPGGDNSGFALDALLCAVICRPANHFSSAAKIVETRRPPGLMNSASARMASGPLQEPRQNSGQRMRACASSVQRAFARVQPWSDHGSTMPHDARGLTWVPATR